MKHTLPITATIVLIFFLSQVIGLYALNVNTNVVKTAEGEIIVEHEDTAIGARPDIEGPETFLYILLAIFLGTGLIFILVKLRKFNVWKAMFFFAVWMTCSITIGVFIPPLYAFITCFLLALFKVYRPNIWAHNVTELFIYAGIALIFVPLLDIVWVTILLLAISAYDMFAVWKSKHMISLAEFQTQSRAFAGVMLSYKVKASRKFGKVKAKGKEARASAEEYKNAILGGGDIAFPLIFSGVVMDFLIKTESLPKNVAFIEAMAVPILTALSLFLLMALAKKDKFYPAMPFLTIGCLAGYGVVWAINFI